MPMSHFQHGFANGFAVRGLPILDAYAGQVLWVNSTGGSDGNKGTHDRPFATLDYAFGKCAANAGDIVMVMPNHAETITGAAGIAHDVAGVSVVGMGVGDQRPRFLMDAGTAVTYAITADDAYIENMVFASGHSNVVTCITTTKKGSNFVGLEFENNTTNEDFLTCIKATSTTNNDSDRLKMVGCRWITSDADDVEMIEVNANLDGFVCTDNFMHSAGTASPLILVAAGKLLTGGFIARNNASNRNTSGELFISNDGTTNTGIIRENFVGHADVTGAHDPGWDAGGWRLMNNYSTSVDNLQGVLVPAADVDL